MISWPLYMNYVLPTLTNLGIAFVPFVLLRRLADAEFPFRLPLTVKPIASELQLCVEAWRLHRCRGPILITSQRSC